MKIQILVDNPNSWIKGTALRLQKTFIKEGHLCTFTHSHEKIETGDVLFLLSCERKFTGLSLNTNNIVIHESDLPNGKGWSPVTWQVLQGKTEIPVCLFEATDEIDSGVIYIRDKIILHGHELNGEIKRKQGEITFKLAHRYILDRRILVGQPQKGEPSYYPRRKPNDSKLDIDISIKEQFNLLRVCDNKRYPAFFEKDGFKYIIKISKRKK